MTMARNQEGRPDGRTGAQRRSSTRKKGAISPEKVAIARPDTSNFSRLFRLARGWGASSRPASQLAIGDNARAAPEPPSRPSNTGAGVSEIERE